MKSDGKERATDFANKFGFWVYGVWYPSVKQTHLDNWIMQIETKVNKLTILCYMFM